MNTITNYSQQNFKRIYKILLGKHQSLKNELQKKYINDVFDYITILSKNPSCRQDGFYEANLELNKTLKEIQLSSLKKYLVKSFVQKDAKKYIDSLFAKIKNVTFFDNKKNCKEVFRIRMREIDIENELKEIDKITEKQGKEKPTGKILARQKTLLHEMSKLQKECNKILANIRQNVTNNTDFAIKNGVDVQDARKLTKYNVYIAD